MKIVVFTIFIGNVSNKSFAIYMCVCLNTTMSIKIVKKILIGNNIFCCTSTLSYTVCLSGDDLVEVEYVGGTLTDK